MAMRVTATATRISTYLPTLMAFIRSRRALAIRSAPTFPPSDASVRFGGDQAGRSRSAICPVCDCGADFSVHPGASLPDRQSRDADGIFDRVEYIERREGRVDIVSRHRLEHCRHWQSAFASRHKDHRYYEIVEDSIHPEFDYLYFVIRDPLGAIQAIQPFFMLDQDILLGVRPYFGRLTDAIRTIWPRFMYMKTMMVGCAAGEAHLDDEDVSTHAANAELLARAIVRHARALGARLIVLKEFPKDYREALSCFVRNGFARIPSMPLTRLNIAYASFDDYMQSALNSATRRKLRKKFRATELDTPIELSVANDITPIIDEIYPLYLQVYQRSKLRFEKLTKAYFCQLGQLMPDTRYGFSSGGARGRLSLSANAWCTAIPCLPSI
jgi:hypothetical protein